MSITATPLPYGLRDIKITPITGVSTLAATAVDFPNARTLSFSEAEDFNELRGDDGLVAVHGQGPAVTWQFEGGGVPFEAIKAMFGGTITETGSGGTATKSFEKTGYDQRPYFQIEGQAISDSGGDFHVVIYKAKCTGELSGEMSDGNFWLTGTSGRALPVEDGGHKLYKFVQNATATDTPTSTPTG
jgi:hypothetical protein